MLNPTEALLRVGSRATRTITGGIVHGARINMPSRTGVSIDVPAMRGRPRYQAAPRAKRGHQPKLSDQDQ